MMKEVNPFYEGVTCQATLPHRTGICRNDRLWSASVGCSLMVSEPWACIGRTELYMPKAGGRHLINQAFLSYDEKSELPRCCCMFNSLTLNVATDHEIPRPPIAPYYFNQLGKEDVTEPPWMGNPAAFAIRNRWSKPSCCNRQSIRNRLARVDCFG